MPAPRPAATLARLLDDQARARPDAVAVRFEGEPLTYAGLARRSTAIAAHLARTRGVRAGDRVAWLGANHPMQLALLFALARLRAVLLPLNFRLAPGEWAAQLADCTPGHLIHDTAFADAARELARAAAARAHPLEALAGVAHGEIADAGTPDASALLVFTSGTTRQPKAAVHTQANLLANMRIASAVQGMTPGDVVATMLPMFHVGGLCIQTLPALHAGAQVVLLPRFAPDAAFDCFERDRPTLTLQVPATMKALVDHPRWASSDLSSLRAVWAGSSLLPRPLVDAFHARGLPVCNVYGATETGPFSIALPPGHAMDHAGSCGWPAPGVEVKLEGAREEEGEVLVRGPNVVAHYWPDVPACDGEGWFHTGDLAARAGDGSYTVVGRAKDLIISGGENIHPAEIEALLAEHAGVVECAAFGVADAQWGEAVAVAVVAKPGEACDEARLRAFLDGRLARFKQPRRWFFVDALPRTALGKVQRAQLQRLA